MAKSSISSKPIVYLLLLAIAIGCASSARILDQLDPFSPTAPNDVETAAPDDADVTTTGPGDEVPADKPTTDPTETDVPDPDTTSAAGPAAPGPDASGAAIPGAAAGSATTAGSSQGAASGGAPQGGAAATAAGGATTAEGLPEHPTISFFMHDVLGGSQASGRVVTGIIATSQASGIPFSQPNNQLFPINNGVPIPNSNINNVINNNNVPYLASLNGQQQQQQLQNTGTNTIVNNGDNNQNAFVSAGQLPNGASLQELMFGSITVIDDQLTEGHELGSAVMGKGQGFYLASSLDGQSHTMAFTALFHGEHEHGEEEDTISIFGVHRVAAPVSYMAVIGGTGKYENAKGFATIGTLPQVDQHTTDGVDTIAHLDVYLTGMA